MLRIALKWSMALFVIAIISVIGVAFAFRVMGEIGYASEYDKYKYRTVYPVVSDIYRLAGNTGRFIVNAISDEPMITASAIYNDYQDKLRTFVPIEKFLIQRFYQTQLPLSEVNIAPWFGVRMTVFPTSGNGSGNIVIASTASPSAGDADIRSVRVMAFGSQPDQSEVFLDETGDDVTILRFSDGYKHDLTQKPFSSSGFGDLNGDSDNETIIFGHLVSSALLQSGGTILFDDIPRMPDESVFISRKDGVDWTAHIRRGLFIDHIEINKLQSGKLSIIQSLRIPTELGRLVQSATTQVPRELFSLPDIDGDGTSELLTIHELGFQIWLSAYGFDSANNSSLYIGEDSPWSPFLHSKMFRFGQFYDYNADGIMDFWISFRGNSKNTKQMWLIDGRRILENASSTSKFPDDLSLMTISDRKFKHERDSFGSSSSLLPGDFDGDAYPEIVIGGHYAGGNAGNLYVVPGELVKNRIGKPASDMVDISDCRVLRILGPISGKLAPPYEHSNNVDFNADGFPDIIVAADTYTKPHPSSGAVLVLSGAKIGVNLERLSRECRPQ